MQGSNKRFAIPVYQRNYDWKEENCKQLYNDLVKTIKLERKSHFFGSVVSVHNPDGRNEEYLVIDGQQRLTTVSLLLLAMYKLIAEGKVTPSRGNLGQQIHEEYLVDKWQEDEGRIKLKPVKNDSLAFEKLFGDADSFLKDSNLTINFNYFYERIQLEEITIDQLFEAFTRLEVITIVLNQEDNPQLIFESLNSTGVALSEGDKIRNFILIGESNKVQEKYYETYWNPMEIATKYEVSAFIRDYLSVKCQAIPSMQRVYLTFKEYVEEEKKETLPLLEELLFYAKQYEILVKAKTDHRNLAAIIFRLNRIETTVARPFFLEVLRLWKEKKLSDLEVESIFSATEDYIVRRNICSLPTSSLNKIFFTLHKDIVRYDGTTENYLQKFYYAITHKGENGTFPEDEFFVTALCTRPIYRMHSKNKTYLLERLENEGSKEDKDIYRHLEQGDYSIEHIMPQHLSSAWVIELGENHQEIHEIWVDRLANLTLTAYNSEYSNHGFSEKKTMKHGFLQSGIRMNQKISQKEQWGLEELEERSEDLKKLALSIWKRPETTFIPEEIPLDKCTLEDDVNLTGKVLTAFSYKEVQQPVTSWISMYEQVLRQFHREDSSVLRKLTNSKEEFWNFYVSSSPDKLRSALQIDTDIYLEKNTSTQLKINILRRFFQLYQAKTEDLVFLFQPTEETVEELARYQLRREYWTFALEKIHEIHGGKIFSNTNPTKSSFLSRFFGIAGCNINCVANFEEGRVELYLKRSTKQETEQLFHKLYRNKKEIEEQVGASLIWREVGKQKSACISKNFEEYGINHKENWEGLSDFHCTWSKKFYDILVPYLR